MNRVHVVRHFDEDGIPIDDVCVCDLARDHKAGDR